jgi:hypothetical protein
MREIRTSGSSADGMTLLAEQIPEHNRELIGLIVKAQALRSADESLLYLPALRNPGEVTLDVCREHTDTVPRQTLRQYLQGYSFPGAGCSAYQPVSISERQRQKFGFGAPANKDSALRIDFCHRLISSLNRPRYCRLAATTSSLHGFRPSQPLHVLRA